MKQQTVLNQKLSILDHFRNEEGQRAEFGVVIPGKCTGITNSN